MTKGTNTNHPSAGSIIAVYPIFDPKKIKEIKEMLANHPRNYALFITGINTAFRASDLLRLKVGDVRGKDQLCIREKKTKKVRCLALNEAVKNAVAPLCEGRKDSDWLFPSEKSGEPLCVQVLNNLVKTWCWKVGIKENTGSHTLRKTFCYFHWKFNKVPIETLSVMLDHSSPRMTYKYIGITPDDISNVYMKEI